MARNKKPVRLEDYPELKQVVTLAEASRLTFRDRKTIRQAIYSGRIAAERCGRVWMIAVRSLVEVYPLENSPLE